MRVRSSSSPGPVKVDTAISPPAISFFIENLIAPLSVMVGVMAIIAPRQISIRLWYIEVETYQASRSEDNPSLIAR